MADNDPIDAYLATLDDDSFFKLPDDDLSLDIILSELNSFNDQSNGGFGEVNNGHQFSNQTNFFPGETSGTAKEIPPQTGEFFTGFGNPVDIPEYPMPPLPYNCTCCQVLREITHSNGDHFTKLELHGRLGIISHAILENRYTDRLRIPPQYQMFDFCKKSLEAVKEMLGQYCEHRKQAGYTMLQDPLRPFYEAICVGMNNEDSDDFLNNFEDAYLTSPLRSSSPVPDDLQFIPTQPVNQVGPQIPVANPPKRSLSMQRKRTQKLKLRDFAEYHSATLEQAANSMNVCPTVLKTICRKHGLTRWPSRRINSLQRLISVKKKTLSACPQERKQRVEAELQTLEEELATILAKFYHP